ncbi:hypothetical protein KEM56_005000 [Ascosphaera pollenicola]|nr:hypothetical protein KEM56_005000 [Ascosphaera pollenicola]
MSVVTSGPARAPWRTLFEYHVSQMQAAEVSLSTVRIDLRTNRAYPRVRTCIFRGFFTEQNLREQNVQDIIGDARARTPEGQPVPDHLGLNPRTLESDLLMITTDVRAGKAGEIESSDPTAPGGPVEILVWAKPVKMQWRIRGRAFVLGANPSEVIEQQSRQELIKWMRPASQKTEAFTHPLAEKAWTFDREILASFANMGPGMRGSFKNPPPGTPKSRPVTDPYLKLGQQSSDLHDEIARQNFRILVIRPEAVEATDFTFSEVGNRMQWTLMTSTTNPGEMRWELDELWP